MALIAAIDQPLSRRDPKGFSVVEVVMVMVIIALFATIAIPRYANSTVRYRIDAAARRIVADLKLAQQHARASSAATTVRFDAGDETILLIGVAGLDDSGSDHTTRLQDEPYKAVIDSVDFGGDADLVFDGFGVPDSSGFVQIVVGGASRRVDVDAAGLATVQ